jgi:hypothetical protein
MLSYPIDEAEELLSSKLAAAQQSLENCEEDLDFLREQITVCFARQYLGDWLRFLDGTYKQLDHGGCHGTSLQLGRHNEAERKE